MTASDLLDDLRRQGFTFRVEGERLLVYPGERLGEAQRVLIREYKGGLLQLLAYPSERVLDLLAGLGPPDFASGPVQLTEVELVTLGGRTVAFRPGEWDEVVASIRQW